MKESATDPHALKVTSEENMLKKLQHSEVSYKCRHFDIFV